ncbi:bifunctional 3-(3-hydroxy-phenyl)propionate/3-hydroxycinnamic acid hydroxylase [Pyxidicoccus sp. MSG2]|uniref:bifunctional 3-(3-hydroxy-phenyl)propionate/3-hydroxycinnamic acid hydroxylase n=1 Tax=Pyxidicoccus sp. MSG2 TaxID=2996790 RepID=UPI00226F1BBB|nr:bifunctional 3-(3-hydroxy-phenyl)propionate/3-hydroxycinnamic acid hydroxylase [Pyxidicoccus sp. MSG2]MCY1021659.1 bifunctional 3-(3-hydroxy-phenyl)propionate/3-hydroxycinnamic acid hydroxylase [Pyxidicoccus sp. MSG2]
MREAPHSELVRVSGDGGGGGVDAPYEVAIIGYGPTGETAANLLGQLGVRTLVLERDSAAYPLQRAIATDDEVLRIWQSIGLVDALLEDMLTDMAGEGVDAAGRVFARLEPEKTANGFTRLAFLHQPSVDRVLRAGAGRFPEDVTVRLAEEVTSLEVTPSYVELETCSPSRGARRVRARYVLACDGGRSPTRERLGIPFSGRTWEDPWLVVDARVKKPWAAHRNFRYVCDPRCLAVDTPLPLGHHRWEFPLASAHGLRSGDSALERAWELLRARGVSEEHIELQRAVVYVHHVRTAARWRQGNVFLCGDAAHVMPPWAGQGMSSGVRDVGNLAWKLAAVLRGQAPDALLDTYQEERMPHVQAMQRLAVGIGQVFTLRPWWARTLRDAAFRAVMATPGLNALLKRGDFKPQPPCHGAAVLRSRRGGPEGTLFPQSLVADRDGRPRRLDDVLPPGFVILGDECDPRAVLPAGATAGWAALGTRFLTVRRAVSTGAGDELADLQGGLARFFDNHGARVVVLRPDRVVLGLDGRGYELHCPEVLRAPRRTTGGLTPELEASHA